MAEHSGSTTSPFASSFVCGDGRIHKAIKKWARAKGIQFVDKATVPGPDRYWSPGYDPAGSFGDPAHGVTNDMRLRCAKADLGIYLNAHNPSCLIIGAHAECAGNPISNQQHIEALERGIDDIRSWHEKLAELPIYAVLVVPNEATGKWEVQEVATRNVDLERELVAA